MTKHVKVFAVVLLLAMVLSLAACGDKNALEGTWEGTNGEPSTISLYADGTFEEDYKIGYGVIHYSGTYRLTKDGSTKIIEFHPDNDPGNNFDDGLVWIYAYEVSSDSLTLKEVATLFGASRKFTKKSY